ncbi:MAG: hypothetical protein WCW13_02650 [archaeon]|jgi:hypothetical protein
MPIALSHKIKERASRLARRERLLKLKSSAERKKVITEIARHEYWIKGYKQVIADLENKLANPHVGLEGGIPGTRAQLIKHLNDSLAITRQSLELRESAKARKLSELKSQRSGI